MFIFKLGCQENRGYHSLTSKCRFKYFKIHDLLYDALHPSVEKVCHAVAFIFPIFLADLDKKSENEIEKDKK